MTQLSAVIWVVFIYLNFASPKSVTRYFPDSFTSCVVYFYAS